MSEPKRGVTHMAVIGTFKADKDGYALVIRKFEFLIREGNSLT